MPVESRNFQRELSTKLQKVLTENIFESVNYQFTLIIIDALTLIKTKKLLIDHRKFSVLVKLQYTHLSLSHSISLSPFLPVTIPYV